MSRSATWSISRSARAPSASAPTIPMLISLTTGTRTAFAFHASRARLTRKAVDEATEAGRARVMTYVNFKLDTDADRIALITWGAPGRSMNIIDRHVIEELSDIVETIAGDGAIRGAVITSGKETFCAGADLTMLQSSIHAFAEMAKARGEKAAATALFEESCKLSLLYRRLETCGKPWVAA